MSRIIISCHEDEPDVPRLVVGWDRPMATYFWQVMGKGDDEGIALKSRGNDVNELPTWQMFMDSLPEEFSKTFSERIIRDLLETIADKTDEGNQVVDTTEWPGWLAEVTDSSGYAANALVFPTKEAAEEYAKELQSRWFAMRDYRIVRTNEQPNYDWSADLNRAVAIR